MKEFVKHLLKHVGFELIRTRAHVEDLLLSNKVAVVLDVGANDGLYARYLRSAGYRGRIVSFEPLREAFEALRAQTLRDPHWEAVNAGLGRADGLATISKARRSVFSSILQPLPSLKEFAYNDIESVGQEQFTLTTLDSQFPLFVHSNEKVFLKIDTQGYEKEVVLGAAGSLASIWGIQLELSLQPLYEGEASISEMISLLEQHGFMMALIDPVTYDHQRGILLQIDCVFLRRNSELLKPAEDVSRSSRR
ncbi:MAG: FkbM family methyltransferase [Bacteroidota bacterium]